jgi:hypothetical protein
MHTLCRLACLILVALPAPLAADPPHKASAPSLLPIRKPILLPCGIADPAGRTGFFASAAGGIEAIDLRTGEVLWDTPEAQRPLVVLGTRLLAQAGVQRNRLRILVFDLTQNGHCVLESDPVILPDWVVTADAPGRSFDAHWHLDRNHLVLSWQAAAWYAGAARPTARQEEAAHKRASGTASINLDTGQVEQGPAPARAVERSASLPPELEKKAVRWQGVVGGVRGAVLLEDAGPEQALVLHAWDSNGKEVGAHELLRGKRLLLQPTLDGHHLCFRDAGAAPDEKNLGKDRPEHHWLVLSLDRPDAVASLPFEPGTQAVAVLGSRAYYCVSGQVRGHMDRPLVQPRTVKAYDLKAGKVLWQRPVAAKLLALPVR